MRLSKKEKGILKDFINEIYFGNWGLEDIKLLHGLKPEYHKEETEKIIYKLHCQFKKWTDYSPIMFGTGHKLTPTQIEQIETDTKGGTK